jgi:hypothetical protein
VILEDFPMKSFFNKLVTKLRGLLGRLPKRSEEALLMAAELVPLTIPVVEQIAKWTPNRTLEEVLAVAKRMEVEVPLKAGEINRETLGSMLLWIATQVIRRHYPELPTYLIQTAVQMALTVVRTR